MMDEVVPESLKNVILVLESSNLFGDSREALENPNDPNHEFWERTWKKLGAFLPSLQSELFPRSDAAPDEIKQNNVKV